LRQSLQSLRRQSYPKLEVLLTDHTGSAAKGELHRLTQDFESKGWRVAPRAWPDCTTEAQGEYVVFMEASDWLIPDAVAIFVRVANETGADVLTCFLDLFSGGQEPSDEACLGHYPFLGSAVVSGVFNNFFGLR